MDAHGPVTTVDLAMHTRSTGAAVRSSMARLEERGLVSRDYTSRGGLIAWRVTRRGAEAVTKHFEEE